MDEEPVGTEPLGDAAATRNAMSQAIANARHRLEVAREKYETGGKTLALLRRKQIAEDELVALLREQHQYDDERDVHALYRDDKKGKRGGGARWPTGKEWQPPRPEHVISRTARIDRVNCADPVPPIPKEQPRGSWWVGADRRQLAIGARALATTPPKKTAVPNAKATIRKIEDQKRFDARTVSGTLQDKLKPQSGDFSELPLAE